MVRTDCSYNEKYKVRKSIYFFFIQTLFYLSSSLTLLLFLYKLLFYLYNISFGENYNHRQTSFKNCMLWYALF